MRSYAAAIAATVLLASGPAFAGTRAAQFLNLGFGSRAPGMAEAFAAVKGDLSSAYYNPAALAWRDPAPEALLSHSWHIQDMSVSQAAFGKGPYAGYLLYFSGGELEGRDASGALNGDFTAEDFALAFGRAFRSGRLGAGATVKVIRQRIKSESGAAAAVDAGLLYEFETLPWAAGVSVSNFGTRLKLDEEAFSLPRALRAGVSAGLGRFLAAAELELPEGYSGTLRLGLEYSGFESLALRAGYRTVPSDERDAVTGAALGEAAGGVSGLYGFYMGLGFSLGKARLDYALLPYGELGSAHRFAVGIGF